MATRKPAKKKPAPKKITPKPLPAMEKGVCGVDGYCCQGKAPEDCCGGSCGSACTVCGCHILPLFFKKRFWVGLILAIGAVMGFDWLWHGRLLMDRYLETSYLWRGEAEMRGLTYYFTLTQVVVAFAYTTLLMLLPSGIVKGIKHGVLLALPLAAATMTTYAVQPIPADILQMWALGYVLQGALVGLIVAVTLHYAEAYKGGCCGGSCQK
ncbi:MAG: hypothetical protein H6922_04675 [Pseudomonadaceae bacterium]|nr:hypothetical protein [Pseudomonadaceae bacterium]